MLITAAKGSLKLNESRLAMNTIRAYASPDAHVIYGAAYDDELGVTGAFNLNMLRHVNRLIGADFNVQQWRHLGFFNEAKSRIEMHLEARETLTVTWQGGARTFAAGERIHTENSYKYRPQAISGLLEESGFGTVKMWTDPNAWFALVYARALPA